MKIHDSLCARGCEIQRVGAWKMIEAYLLNYNRVIRSFFIFFIIENYSLRYRKYVIYRVI